MNIDGMFERYFDISKENKEYLSFEENILDYFALLDIYIFIAFGAKVKFRELYIKGITLSSESIKGMLESSCLDKRNIVLSEKNKEEIIKAENYIKGREKFSSKEVTKIRNICEIFNLGDFWCFFLVASVSVNFDKKYETLFSVLQNNPLFKYPSIGIIIALYNMIDTISLEEMGYIFDIEQNPFKFLFEVKSREELSLSSQMKVKERIISYLFNSDCVKSKYINSIKCFCDYEEIEENYIFKYELNHMEDLLSNLDNGKTNIFNIYGSKGIGKRDFVKKLMSQMEMPVVLADLEEIEEFGEFQENIILESYLRDAVICLYNVKNDELHINIIRFLAKMANELFILSEEKLILNIENSAFFPLELNDLTANQRLSVWENSIKKYNCKNIDIEMTANKYILNSENIIKVLDTAQMNAFYMGKDFIEQSDIVEAVKKYNENQLGEQAVLINACFTWEDLVVNDEQRKQLNLICNHIKYKRIIEEEWGFAKKTPYGKGISAMFFGLPGTGKTMAVQVIANELGMDLYRIDISQMISKYIGETEKNISELFKRAKKINAILFFDEADSLFAKRSEVNDSNDRSANAQTAHLLQKLEEYEGISILATNYLGNIDEAFKRRIKFIVNFEFPDAKTRLKLWKTILPKEAKTEKDLDFEFFAEKFELSGSNIKEILTNAAYIAVSEGKKMSNYHIVEAIKNNYNKDGKILIREDFGEYGIYI